MRYKRWIGALILTAILASSHTAIGQPFKPVKIKAVQLGKRIGQVTFSPDGKRLAVSDNKNIKVFDTATWRQLATYGSGGRDVLYYPVRFNHDGTLLGADAAYIWDVDTPGDYRIYYLGAATMAFHPDGEHMVTGAHDEEKFDLWNLNRGGRFESLKKLDGGKHGVREMTFSPDGRWLATMGENDDRVRIWRTDKWKRKHSIKRDRDAPVDPMYFTQDGERFVFADYMEIKIVNTDKGKVIQTILTDAEIHGMALSSDDRYVVVGQWLSEIQIRDMTTGRVVATLDPETQFYNTVAISPDNTFLACGTYEGKLVVWDLTGKAVADNTPPRIVYEAPAFVNGRMTTSEPEITVSGSVSDNIGVTEFLLNGKPNETTNGRFRDKFTLFKDQRNRLRYTAIDNAGNAVRDTLYIIHKSPAGDKEPPVITVLQPSVMRGFEIVSKNSKIGVLGMAKDHSGIRQVLVNGVRAVVKNGSFSAQVALAVGSNTLRIEATDNNGNTASETFRIRRESDPINAPDRTAPVVTILEPKVRGFEVVSKQKDLQVHGRAEDASGIYEVMVNGVEAQLGAGGEFWATIHLAVGSNTITVRATDTRENTGTQTFTVLREQVVVDSDFIKGKYYALVVGINAYSGAWPALNNAVHDAEAVAEALRSTYGFDQVITLFDKQATRVNIIMKLEELARSVKEEDNVLIYYSGHGILDKTLNKGYWVPVDATMKSTAFYLSNADIQAFLDGIRSKHTLLVADACFSGDIFRGDTFTDDFDKSDTKYYQNVYGRASREAITSGGLEPVMDGGRDGHSVFTYYFLKALRGNTDRYLTSSDVFHQLAVPVVNNSEQTPVHHPIKNTGDEGGYFVFRKR